MEFYAAVRRSVYVEGLSERAAARRFGLARETVRKMLRYRRARLHGRLHDCQRLRAQAEAGRARDVRAARASAGRRPGRLRRSPGGHRRRRMQGALLGRGSAAQRRRVRAGAPAARVSSGETDPVSETGRLHRGHRSNPHRRSAAPEETTAHGQAHLGALMRPQTLLDH